jgi:hypothetical protein
MLFVERQQLLLQVSVEPVEFFRRGWIRLQKKFRETNRAERL